MSDLLNAARRALPGCVWDIHAHRVRDLVFKFALYSNRDGTFDARIDEEWHKETSPDRAAAWLRAQVTDRRDALNAALGEGWVPVGERLPDLRTHVLAWDGTQIFTALRLTEVWISFGPDRCGSVTHWMPLPAPPKEGGK